MANMIKNNMPSLRTLNQLNKNTNLLTKSLQKVSSGMKINSAADSASAYSISEKMRVQLRALDQCNANTKTGANMLSVAEGAIDNQIDLIKRMKEIALDAANDTNTDADRAIMQKEVNARLMELNNISYSTEYNGRQLLNGVMPGEQTTSFKTAAQPSLNTTPVIPETPNTNALFKNLPVYAPNTNFLQNPPNTVYDPNQITWSPDPSGTTYTIGQTVYDSSHQPHNVVRNPNTNNMSVYIGGAYQDIGAPSGFTAYNGTMASVLLSNATIGNSYSTTPKMPGDNYTAGTLPDGTPALTTTNRNGNTSGFYDLNLPSTNLPASLDQQGFSVLCDQCRQFVCVKFDATLPANTGQHHIDNTVRPPSECYVIGIAGLSTINDIYNAMEQGISQITGTSPTGSSVQQLTSPWNHNVCLHFYDDASGNKHCYITKDGNFDLSLYNGVAGQVETVGGKLPWQNLVIQGDTVSSQFTRLQLPNTTLDALFPAQNSTWDIEPKESDYPNPWPKGYEEDRTWPPEWGEDFIENNSLEEKRRRLWREETWPYPAKGAISTASCVSTREKALKFVQSLDQALKYLTNAATTLGVQEVRLNYMNDNIVTSHENTTAAESVIRDADMAKEMTNYSKYNVLAQSAQSMLAQANQNLGSSLDLLQ